MARKGLFADLSGLQLVAGALAAMTSAWLASWLGVAGTLIGAAVGSLVAGLATTLYSTSLQRGIERSKTLLVTEQGSVVEATPDEESSVEAGTIADAPAAAAPGWKDRLARVNWKSVALVSGATLLIAVAVIGAYEYVSGDSFGNTSNSRIVPTSVGGGDTSPQDPGAPAPAPGETATSEPTGDAPSSTPTPEETPSEAPTTEAPTVPQPTPSLGESTPAP